MASSVSGAASLVVQLLTSLPQSEEAALFEACSLAHQTGGCIEIPEATEADTLRASVDFSNEMRVVIEITDRAPGRNLYASRELFFEPSDDREERARAIGLALGVLATTLGSGRQLVDEAEPLPSDSSPSDSPETHANERDPETSKNASPLLGPWGMSLSLGMSLLPSWGEPSPTGAFGVLGFPHPNFGGKLRAQLAASLAGTRDVAMTHVAATLGPMFRTRTSPFFFTASVAGGIQTTEARLNVPNAETRKGSHLSPLGHVEITFGRELGPGVALTFTPTFDYLISETEILVDGQVVGRTGTIQSSLFLGLLLMPSP